MGEEGGGGVRKNAENKARTQFSTEPTEQLYSEQPGCMVFSSANPSGANLSQCANFTGSAQRIEFHQLSLNRKTAGLLRILRV